MTTTPTVIREGIDPLVVTTKFDVDHEHDSETGKVAFVDVTASLYLQHGDSAIKLDFGVFGNADEPYLAQEFNEEIVAIERLINTLHSVRAYLKDEVSAALRGSA